MKLIYKNYKWLFEYGKGFTWLKRLILFEEKNSHVSLEFSKTTPKGAIYFYLHSKFKQRAWRAVITAREYQ